MGGPVTSATSVQKSFENSAGRAEVNIPSFPMDLIERIFLLLSPRDLVRAAQMHPRTYSVLPRILARFPSEKPLESFLNAVIAHNRFDKVLPPLNAVSEPNPLTLSLLCDNLLKAQTLKKIVECLPRLRTMRLHVSLGQEAREAFSLIAKTLAEEKSQLRRLILSGVCDLQPFEAMVGNCASLTELDISDLRFSSSNDPSNALMLPESKAATLPNISSPVLSRLRVNPEQFSLAGVDHFQALFAKCPNLGQIDFLFFVNDLDSQVLHKPIVLGRMLRSSQLYEAVVLLALEYQRHVELHNKRAKFERQIRDYLSQIDLRPAILPLLKAHFLDRIVLPPINPIQLQALQIVPIQNRWHNFLNVARSWLPFI